MTDDAEARRAALRCPTCGYDGPGLYEETAFQAEHIARLQREVAADRGLAPGEDFASFLVHLHRQAIEDGPDAVAELAALHAHYAREAGKLDGPPPDETARPADPSRPEPI